MSHKAGATRILLHIEEPKCRFPYFFPAGRYLRSTIRAERLKHQSVSPIITSLGEIPGEEIEYDGEQGMAWIRDRRAFKEYEEHRKELQRQVAASQTIIDPAASGPPRQEEVYHLHTDDDRATWLAHMIRLVDSGAAVVKKGTLPTKQEVDRMGTWTKGEFFGFSKPEITKHFKVTEQKTSNV